MPASIATHARTSSAARVDRSPSIRLQSVLRPTRLLFLAACALIYGSLSGPHEPTRELGRRLASSLTPASTTDFDGITLRHGHRVRVTLIAGASGALVE